MMNLGVEHMDELALTEVCDLLDREFAIDEIKDDWSFSFDDLFKKYAVPKFLQPERNTGLFLQFGKKVRHIYTGFAPSKYLLQEVKRRGIQDAMLVVKHPFDWDGSATGQGFLPFTEDDYRLMEEMRLSIYSLHTPWDKNRNDTFVSTAYGLARALDFKVESEFADDPSNPGLQLGLIGTLPIDHIEGVVEFLATRLGHRPKYMHKLPSAKRIALVTGGGFISSIIAQAKALGCDTYITGIITPNDSEWSKSKYPQTHAKVDAIGINVIGASHYLTEKFAPEQSLKFFEQFGVPVEFIEDKEALNKLE